MKILIDARLYGVENAGLGRYLMGLINGLEKCDRKNKYILLLRKKYFNLLKLKPNFSKINLDVRHYGFLEQFRVWQSILREKPDLVHIPHFNVPIFYRGDVVVTIHDLLMHKQKGKTATTLPFIEYFTKRLFYKLIFFSAVKYSRKIIVPSEYVKREILDYYDIKKDKVSVIYEGVSNLSGNEESGNENNVLDKYKLNDKKYLLYVGNAYPHKNLRRLIDSLKLVKQRNVMLVIASSRNIFTERLKKYIRRNNMENYVEVIYFPSDEELALLYKKSIAGIFPSISEGFGLPGLEAMANGTICLVSDISVFKEIYKDKAMYFDPFNVKDMARVIDECFNLSNKVREKMIFESKLFAKKYSWDNMACETKRLYESCVGV